MIDIESVRELALALPGVEEKDHWGKPSFRVKNKIFSTLWADENKAMVKLTPVDQSVFCEHSAFSPVPGGWGRQGATFVDLGKVRKDMFRDALKTAYNTILGKKPTKKSKK